MPKLHPKLPPQEGILCYEQNKLMVDSDCLIAIIKGNFLLKVKNSRPFLTGIVIGLISVFIVLTWLIVWQCSKRS